MTKPLLFVLLLLPVCLMAQSRNEIKFIGADFDMMLKPASLGQEQMINNRLAAFVGYYRLIGTRLSVGVTYHKFINFDEDGSGRYNDIQYDFKETAWALGYHTRYFFSDHDEEGPNSGYVEFSLNRTSLAQSYTDITDYGNNGLFGSPKKLPSFDNSYAVNRYGITVGLINSDVLTRDISLGVYFNGSSSSSHPYSLSEVRGLSFILTYSLGISF